jgi:DNA polymerase-3 subunit delta
MQLAAAQLATHLNRGLCGLYVLHGDEILLQQEAADAIRAAARAKGYAERSVFTVAGAAFDWSALLSAGSSLSLFSDKQILDIRIPSGKPGRDGSAALQQLAAGCSDDSGILVLITLPRLDRQTKTGAWFGALEHAGVAIQLDPVALSALPQWIATRLATQGQRVVAGEEGQRTLQFFAARVEGNLLAAHQEIQKLALLYPPGELRWAEVEAAVLNVARYDVFKLSESVLQGRAAHVQRMLDGLQAEGVAPVLVHWALAEDIRALKRIRDALEAGTPLPLALRQNRIWGFKERLFERILRQLSQRDAARLLEAAHRVDRVVKGLPAPGWPGDSWLALHRLAWQMGQVCAPAPAH